jgi:hypothetical protein
VVVLVVELKQAFPLELLVVELAQLEKDLLVEIALKALEGLLVAVVELVN